MNHVLRRGARRLLAFTSAPRTRVGHAARPHLTPNSARPITSRAGLATADIYEPSPPEHLEDTTTAEDIADKDIYADEISEFGVYSVILPEEPYVFGTDHIVPRTVPSRITRPPYVGAPISALHNGDPWTGDGRIILKGEDERKLRTAARLAKTVLDYAGSLVKVGPPLLSCSI